MESDSASMAKPEQTVGHCSIDRVPTEVLINILQDLTLSDLNKARLTSKAFANAVALTVVKFVQVTGNFRSMLDTNEVFVYASRHAVQRLEHLRLRVNDDRNNDWKGLDRHELARRLKIRREFTSHVKSLDLSPLFCEVTTKAAQLKLLQSSSETLTFLDNLTILHLDLQWVPQALQKMFRNIRLERLQHLQLRHAITAETQLAEIVLQNSSKLQTLDLWGWKVVRGSWVMALMKIADRCARVSCRYTKILHGRSGAHVTHEELFARFQKRHGGRFKLVDYDPLTIQEHKTGVRIDHKQQAPEKSGTRDNHGEAAE